MSITLVKTLICRNLYGLEGKQDMKRQNELRDLTALAVREKELRQWGPERVGWMVGWDNIRLEL